MGYFFFLVAFFAVVFLAAFFFAGIPVTSLPQKMSEALCELSEQPPLAAGRTIRAAGAAEPFFELTARDPPDTTDPDRGDPRRVRVVHRAEAAQDGRGVNAQAGGDLVGRQVLVIAGGGRRAHCICCDGCVSMFHLRGRILTARLLECQPSKMNCPVGAHSDLGMVGTLTLR